MRYKLLPTEARGGVGELRQKALSQLYSKLKGEFKRKYGVELKDPKLFNSGYYGLTMNVNGLKVIILDQPGVVGLEDHSVGYIEVKCNNQSKKLISHRDRRFGDVNINEEERATAYALIPDTLATMLGLK